MGKKCKHNFIAQESIKTVGFHPSTYSTEQIEYTTNILLCENCGMELSAEYGNGGEEKCKHQFRHTTIKEPRLDKSAVYFYKMKFESINRTYCKKCGKIN